MFVLLRIWVGPNGHRLTRQAARLKGRVAVGEEPDVGLHSQRVALDADEEVADALGILCRDQDGEEPTDEREQAANYEGDDDQIVRDGQEPFVQRLPPVEVLGVGEAERGVGLDSVIVSGRLEVERRVVLVEEHGIAERPPLVAVGHGDHVEQRPGDAFGEQHGEQADHRQDLAQGSQHVGDQQVGDGQ